MNFRPAFWGLEHRMTLMVSTVNLLAGIDEWCTATTICTGGAG